jgi:hypothetical protein
VTPDLQVGGVDSLKKTRFKVGRDDVTVAPHLVAKPLRYRPASASDL